MTLATTTKKAMLHLTLKRPHALNAINLDIVRNLQHQLQLFAQTPTLNVALLTASQGDRAFCAGGDVKQVMLAAKKAPDTDHTLPDAFFREEYALNAQIAALKKPLVSVWDGIVMGGGAGISVHGRYRVASEHALFAMPEASIGFFPDVGASYFLSNLDGELGTYLALTGSRIGSADLLYTGLATHYVERDALADFYEGLGGCDDDGAVGSLLGRLGSAPASPPPLEQVRERIDRCFGQPSVVAIEEALERDGSEWGAATLSVLRKTSPTSRAVALRLLREARGRSLEECLVSEFRASQRFMEPPSDFFEGIRAALIDKDRSPRWSPSTSSEVSKELIDSYFAPVKAGDAKL